MHATLLPYSLAPFSARYCHSSARSDSDGLGYAEHGSGWLCATLRWDGASRWLLLTGPHPSNVAHWSPLATASGQDRFEWDAPKRTAAQRQRAKLALAALAAIRGRTEASEHLRLTIGGETCAACSKVLLSNAATRTVPADSRPGSNGADLSGQTVSIGPGCWETVTGQREARQAEREAARLTDPRFAALAALAAAAAPAAPLAEAAPAAPRCPGTCALDAHCPDCD